MKFVFYFAEAGRKREWRKAIYSIFSFLILFDYSLLFARDIIVGHIYTRIRFLRFIVENLADPLSHRAFNSANTNRTNRNGERITIFSRAHATFLRKINISCANTCFSKRTDTRAPIIFRVKAGHPNLILLLDHLSLLLSCLESWFYKVRGKCIFYFRNL